MGRKKLTIFLTGSGGYIGRNIKEQLSDKYIILAPNSHELDLTNSESVKTYFLVNTIDVVIHGAVVGGSRTEEQQSDALKINLRMIMNILRNSDRYSKLIHLGSGAEYDKTQAMTSISEHDFDRSVPNDEYGFYKYLCSRYISQQTNAVNLRIFGIFGKYEDYRLRFISNAICRNILQLPITINRNVYFDYVYINDFVRILDHFIQHSVSEMNYNIATGQKIDLVTIAETINEIADHTSEIHVKQPGLNLEYTADADLLKSELGSFSFTPFKQSVADLYQWYKKNMTALEITQETV